MLKFGLKIDISSICKVKLHNSMKYFEKYCLITNLTLTLKKYPAIQFCLSTVWSPVYEVFKIELIGECEKKLL